MKKPSKCSSGFRNSDKKLPMMQITAQTNPTMLDSMKKEKPSFQVYSKNILITILRKTKR